MVHFQYEVYRVILKVRQETKNKECQRLTNNRKIKIKKLTKSVKKSRKTIKYDKKNMSLFIPYREKGIHYTLSEVTLINLFYQSKA